MAEVYQTFLCGRVGTRLAVIHLRASLRLEHARAVERERTFQVSSRRSGIVWHLHARFRVVRAIHIRVHLETEHVQQFSGGVVVVLVLEALVGFQQVVHMIRAKNEHTAVFGHLHVVIGTLQGYDVLYGQFLASRFVGRAAGCDNRSLVRMAVGSQGVGGFLVLHRQNGIAMTFHVSGILVERQGV